MSLPSELAGDLIVRWRHQRGKESLLKVVWVPRFRNFGVSKMNIVEVFAQPVSNFWPTMNGVDRFLKITIVAAANGGTCLTDVDEYVGVESQGNAWANSNRKRMLCSRPIPLRT